MATCLPSIAPTQCARFHNLLKSSAIFFHTWGVLGAFKYSSCRTEIANHFGVSKRTLERRSNEIGVSVKASYAILSDGELDSVVSDIVSQFRNVG